jgi:carbon storage regulator
MLVTLRRQGEALLIGDDIEISIVRIGRSRVRVGIRAPRQYRVVPGEKRQAREIVPAVPQLESAPATGVPPAIPILPDCAG